MHILDLCKDDEVGKEIISVKTRTRPMDRGESLMLKPTKLMSVILVSRLLDDSQQQ